MTISTRTLLVLLFAPSLLMPASASAQSFTRDQRGEIETVLRDYLISHPELLQEVIAEINKRQANEQAEKRRAAVTANESLIFNSPHQVAIGNARGDVTMVEFFDYNCAFCKRALSDMLDLMNLDSKLKVVLKEFPVLGEGSTETAYVAVAARMQDKSGGTKYLEFHQKLLGGRGRADKERALAVAEEVGFDVARLEKDMASEEVKTTIAENFKLAEAMGFNGTPSYVIGTDVVIGAVGVDALREKLNIARCGKASC